MELVKLETNQSLGLKRYTAWRRSTLLTVSLVLGVSAGASANASENFDKLLSNFLRPETCIGRIDWFDVGLSDGKLGFEREYFGVYEEACARRFRAPDKQAYFEAYNIGIRSYCDPDNIYRLALGGSVVTTSCEQTPALREAVQRGFVDLKRRKVAAN